MQKDNTQKLINKLKPGEHFGEKALLNDNDLRNVVFELCRFVYVFSVAPTNIHNPKIKNSLSPSIN